ncbi:Fanconi anemia core complex-associated protein 24 isoform 3-T4 [Spinachia spinachia]
MRSSSLGQISTCPTGAACSTCPSATWWPEAATRGNWPATGISHGFQELVLVEKTRLGEQYFSAVQKLVVFDLGLTLLPVGGQAEAAQLIAQIVHGVGRENPFRRRTSSRLLDPLVLALVQRVPGVGRVKALVLLERFSSIHQLCNATPSQLEPIVGQAAAQQIHGFFHTPTAAGT